VLDAAYFETALAVPGSPPSRGDGGGAEMVTRQ